MEWSDYVLWMPCVCSSLLPTFKSSDIIEQELMDNAFLMFHQQLGRQFILSASVTGTSIRLTQYDRSRTYNGAYIDGSQNLTIFVRIIVGLMFCEPGDIGYDLTVISEADAGG